MKYLAIILLTIIPRLTNAQDFPQKPTNYITNETSSITADEEKKLNSKLRRYEDSTSNQIFVYVANSLNGKDLEQFCQDIFHNWKIGQDGKNNGVLIAIFINDHKFRIQTGYGLEGVLPDLLTKQIQDNDMRPLFKENRYYEGIDKGVDQLIYYSKHEFSPSETEVSSVGVFIFFYVFASVFLLIIVLIAKGIKDRPTAKKTVIIISVILFLIPFLGAFFLIFMILVALAMRKDLLKTSSGGSNWSSSSSDSSWSSSDSSSSWSSSDSSSSFDGGGGGDSGGGGSSSDW
jgi:uncharacterized protein